MIAPGAVVGDIHADLALAGSRDQHAIHVDVCFVEKRRWLPRPHTLANVIEDVDERMHIVGPKTSAEIAGRGRIGDALRVEGVEIGRASCRERV